MIKLFNLQSPLDIIEFNMNWQQVGFILALCSYGSLALELLDTNCVKKPVGINTQIYGGETADIRSHPWMAQILCWGQHFCGGSLISSQFVLTAAHCQWRFGLKVRLGGYNGTTAMNLCSSDNCSPAGAEIDVKAIFVPNLYWDYHTYDIALFQLAVPVKYNAQIRPICVMQTSNEGKLRRFLNYVSTFNVTGWGKTESSETSTTLQSASLYHLDRGYCFQIFDRAIYWPHICAGHSQSSTCTGDSGGPLSAEMTFLEWKHPILFGVVSYGASNCREVTVFTNVLHYTNWIRDVVRSVTPTNNN
ncbi:chymotrypsin-like protease CTRL-1 [Drosophila teissieri]|uniref:chymotrypsin-like protease CTRL-1 n=1 Tax=Drosophila teissieri TaxID=7243 RepID=UPI001CBA58B8|nr:chymotrypsin-like protease CTRL-1 [Drosophila teissieri]